MVRRPPAAELDVYFDGSGKGDHVGFSNTEAVLVRAYGIAWTAPF
jgi:hypothetical protein